LYTYFDYWKFPRFKDKNVIAINNGTDQTSDATILICAHYDTYTYPRYKEYSVGAIDDGTGIAAMLAIANITKESSFNHTIRFVAVGAEEVGAYGSFADAKKAYWDDENIFAVLNIDSIGFDNTSEKKNIVELVGQSRSYWLADFIKDISEKYRSQFDVLPRFCGGNYPADQESYYDYGYDGIMFVQTQGEKYMEDLWHTPYDTIDKVDFSYLEKITKLLLATACELAINPIDVQVRIITPMEGCIYIRNFPIKLPCFNLVFSRIRALTYIIGKTTVKINITTNEEINSVYFGLDGYLRHACNEEPYEYTIRKGDFRFFFRGKNHHRLTVAVTTNTGKVATDEMDIYIVRIF